MNLISLENSRIDSIGSVYKFHTIVDVLRLDLIHSVISGNKWFKLQEYFKEAIALGIRIIITFGGAFSNHIVATAAAAKNSGLKSIGIIRGEEPIHLSPTLKNAMDYDMQLFFISRNDYKHKKLPDEIFKEITPDQYYLINEGGYGFLGAKGAREILRDLQVSGYTHIISAVGTGTTLAGLTNACNPGQLVIGISVMKNNLSLQAEIEDLVAIEKKNSFLLNHLYHFGGYAKYTPQLISFMNEWFRKTNIPTDFVYTAKLFFAVNDLILNNYFPENSKILIIHSGGLQGNQSLSKGTLIFS